MEYHYQLLSMSQISEFLEYHNITPSIILSPRKPVCEHFRQRAYCKDCKGSQICKHSKRKSACKDCKGRAICEHSRQRTHCKDCKGSQICEHSRQKTHCRDCKGSQICEHSRVRSQCKDCKGGSICEHFRIRSKCKDCGGSQICEHSRQKSQCKDCGGSQICEHSRRKSICKDCKNGSIYKFPEQKLLGPQIIPSGKNLICRKRKNETSIATEFSETKRQKILLNNKFIISSSIPHTESSNLSDDLIFSRTESDDSSSEECTEEIRERSGGSNDINLNEYSTIENEQSWCEIDLNEY